MGKRYKVRWKPTLMTHIYTRVHNGKSSKKVQYSASSFELEALPDRDGSFEPNIVKKRQTLFNRALDEKILGFFSVGMSYSDILRHLSEIGVKPRIYDTTLINC